MDDCTMLRRYSTIGLYETITGGVEVTHLYGDSEHYGWIKNRDLSSPSSCSLLDYKIFQSIH
jgi:hypothetical protein